MRDRKKLKILMKYTKLWVIQCIVILYKICSTETETNFPRPNTNLHDNAP